MQVQFCVENLSKKKKKKKKKNPKQNKIKQNKTKNKQTNKKHFFPGTDKYTPEYIDSKLLIHLIFMIKVLKLA